ncbi:metallophosphoesterase [Microbacterium invictum]|uniref:Calcineurin-like phosphoesterase domain-containing protein n=1 Tax=Microbacterium invictum TaxID=515415 RepID=A0AA40SQD3_9MICO|nr:metallophosphoesterase [Microbacterium invictum]MBB4140436.1 hypothetical protein [Microbacterium invictum]
MALTAQESVDTFDLDDREAIVAGDWHGNLAWVGRAIPAAARTGVRTLLHLGDFGFWPGGSADLLATVDHCVAKSWERTVTSGIERVLVTPGNHEDWASLDSLFAAHPGRAVRVSESVWVLPRGFRFAAGGRSFLSFGGAASIDYAYRVALRSWWPSEMPSLDDIRTAVVGGATDVLLTHDAGLSVTPQIAAVLTGPSQWVASERQYSGMGRTLIDYVLTATNPLLQLHGHHHLRDTGVFEREGMPPLRVEALGMDGQDGNVTLLNLDDLSVTDLEVSR